MSDDLSKLLKQNNGPVQCYPHVLELINTVVQEVPQSIAIVENVATHTYQSLWDLVVSQAISLHKSGLARGQIVAVHSVPSLFAIVSILAVWGGARCYSFPFR